MLHVRTKAATETPHSEDRSCDWSAWVACVVLNVRGDCSEDSIKQVEQSVSNLLLFSNAQLRKAICNAIAVIIALQECKHSSFLFLVK